MSDNNLDLLRQFIRDHSQGAFTTLVQRHVNLVYSAALRQVRSPQLAEDIAQSVFADLARSAEKLAQPAIGGTPVLTAWLYAVTRRTAIDAIRKESRRQLREQIAVEMNNMNATENEWTHIEPLLDDAMAALDETDRSAILLRYFENKSLREVGEALGTSDDAAQKRVSRAMERLRDFFSKRNVTVGASGLAVLISANAVQAAPIGLAATISAAVLLAGTTVHTSTIIAATKTIAMTTIQKTLVTVTVAVLAGAGIYEARQAAQLRQQNQTLRQQQAPLAEQIQQLQRERDDATNRLAGLRGELAKANSNSLELLRLRAEVSRLKPLVAEKKSVSEQKTANDYLAMNQLRFVGYSSPQLAFESLRWALVSSNYDVWVGSMSPVDQQSDDVTRSHFGPNSNWNQKLSGIQVLAEKRIGNNMAELKVREDGESGTQILIWPFALIGNEWKFHGEIHSYYKDWEQDNREQYLQTAPKEWKLPDAQK